MSATAARTADRLKARPELHALERRDVPAFTTPVFTAVGPVSATQPVDWNLVASVRVTGDLAETQNGNAVTATIQDIRTDNTPVTVNLLTYTRDPANSAPPGDINLQKLYALDTQVLNAPGQSVTLTANLPMCSLYQADVALGTLSPDVKASVVFPNTNIESVFGSDTNCCTPTPPPVTPPPPPCHNPPPCQTPPPPCGQHTPPSCGDHDHDHNPGCGDHDGSKCDDHSPGCGDHDHNSGCGDQGHNSGGGCGDHDHTSGGGCNDNHQSSCGGGGSHGCH